MADYVLTDYLEQALAMAVYDKLDDGTFAGRIPPCKGVVAFADLAAESVSTCFAQPWKTGCS